MWRLLQNIAKDDEHGLYLGTNDFFRPGLKQIGNSLYEIRSYFIQKDGQGIAPTKLTTSLEQVKKRLIEHVENHAFDFVFDPLTSEVVDYPNPKAGPCFMFLAHSLSVVLDFPTSPRPSHTVCDVFLALPTQPVIVLSLVDGDAESPEAVMYNTSVARGVIETLSRFTDEDVNSIHGVIHTSILEDAASFETQLKRLANDSSHFVTRDSLVMTPGRYEKVLTAFWAGVAETKSVLKDTGDTDGDCLRFLTKEQCIILVENINDKDVQVKCLPGSGATTLMLEVARRLNRQGDTLLVCRSREERDRLRSVYPSAVAAEDLSTVDLSSCVNIVDETNTVMTHASSRNWRFAQICEAEREKEGMKKQIDVLSDDAWKKQIEYLLRDFSVLKIFSYKLEQTWRISVRPLRHSLEVKPLWLTTSKALGGFGQLSAPHKAQLSDLHEGMRLRKNMFPLLRSVMIKDKTLQMYHEVKMAHLRNALGKKEYTEWKHNFTMDGHVESPGIEQQMERLHFESGKEGRESDIQPVRKEGIQTTELEIEPQDTDGKDLESRWGEIDKLNHDLDNLLKDRDHRKEKLHKLYTVEWQATMEYLTRHTTVLSVLDIEVPGFDVLSGSITSQSDNTSDGRGHNKEQESKGHTRAPVLIHQLRQYQQGRLTENHLAAIALKVLNVTWTRLGPTQAGAT
ncbi:uncharacterized protein LOC124151394 isoform X3 [Haliotis rufescens]|uniref:uncharacterized protein LOC124151394 isoform X3 n=1 Tax=Haliotis rufescens TaxID=6454 RepID=UPI00201ECC84|nr:uncharacterized protein LOC124151394 isoform X3 [Haliotis rufescens]